MSDPLDLADLSSRNATATEQFAQDNAAIDRAWKDGKLAEWLQEKLKRERIAAGFDT